MSHEASLAAVAEDASDLADLGGELLLHGGQPLLVRLTVLLHRLELGHQLLLPSLPFLQLRQQGGEPPLLVGAGVNGTRRALLSVRFGVLRQSNVAKGACIPLQPTSIKLVFSPRYHCSPTN